MNVFSSKKRPKLLKKLANTTYDLLVIGGGATGSGIALDAASRGLSTALIDKQDFAAGTSSRSTKLIHGGLRYLKQFEVALVREVGRERATVHKLAPHLVVSEKMLLPLIKGGTYGKLATSLGLMVYDVLAGVESADQRVMLSKDKTMELEPLLNEDLLEGSGFYAEYRTDDARLSLEVLKTAALYGAHSINYVEAQDFIYEDKMVVGAKCQDLLGGESFEIKAKQVVNAAGPWVD
ncbi:MAG: FAD-dependent oxidoreductase, partial [Bacteroidota bacterium]